MAKPETGSNPAMQTELSPITPITEEGVRTIVIMYEGALTRSRNAQESVRHRSMTGVPYRENGALSAVAEQSDIRAGGLAQILTMLGQKGLVNKIKEEVYKPK